MFDNIKREDIPRILRNEFTEDIMYMETMDIAYHKSLNRSDDYHKRNYGINWNKGKKMPTIVSYEHYGKRVFVQIDLLGRHKEHCLCFKNCKNFKPDQPDNCKIAQAVFENCVKFHITTPMWECPEYKSL